MFFQNFKVLKQIIEIYENKDDLTSGRALDYLLGEIYEECGDIYLDYLTCYLFQGTPIERLFYHCFRYICSVEDIKLYLKPQVEIETENKKYIVDFLIREFKNHKFIETKFIIECDGFDYHSSKKQQAYDNQRQRDLENAGYTIIRFSGKEIYDDEVKCVYETLKRLNIEEGELYEKGIQKRGD